MPSIRSINFVNTGTDKYKIQTAASIWIDLPNVPFPESVLISATISASSPIPTAFRRTASISLSSFPITDNLLKKEKIGCINSTAAKMIAQDTATVSKTEKSFARLDNILHSRQVIRTVAAAFKKIFILEIKQCFHKLK